MESGDCHCVVWPHFNGLSSEGPSETAVLPAACDLTPSTATDRITSWQAVCLPPYIVLKAGINPRRAHCNLEQSLLSVNSKSSRIFVCYKKIHTHTERHMAEKKKQ